MLIDGIEVNVACPMADGQSDEVFDNLVRAPIFVILLDILRFTCRSN
jgi:hypothetical protein